MLKEYVVDESKVAARGAGSNGAGSKLMLDGRDRGPEALFTGLRPVPSETRESPPTLPHLHRPPQFQLGIRGTAKFPSHDVRAIGAHYTDPGVAYGPFTRTNDWAMYVVHATPGGFMWMTNPEARKVVSRGGREYYGSVAGATWEPAPNGARKAVLFRDPQGVAAEVFECPPGKQLSAGPAEYGRYEIVLKGSMAIGGKMLPCHSLRFVVGDEAPGPLTAGPDGATVVLLHFDSAAKASFESSFLEDFESGAAGAPRAGG